MRKEGNMRLLLTLLLIAGTALPIWAQDLYRSARPIEVERAVSQIGEAEYYIGMALRALDLSGKEGRAPFFDYRRAREDLKAIRKEFVVYLSGTGSPATEPASVVTIDGRYFSKSIKDYIIGLKPRLEGAQSAEKKKGAESKEKSAAIEPPTAPSREMKREVPATEKKEVQKESEIEKGPPPSSKKESELEEKIGKILKKGI